MEFSILLLLEIIVTVIAQETVLYDAYFGTPLTAKRENFLAGVVNASLCTIPVRPCQKEENRRVDGTCTNPHYPSRAAGLSPFPRLLPAQFGPGNSLRPARDGTELPSTRLLRTTLVGDGFFNDHEFSTLATHFQVGTATDNGELFYLLRYVAVSDCCLGNTPNRINPLCIPIPVPGEDPFIRSTGIRCLNLTRVETYQDYGCLPPNLPAERLNRKPPLLDLDIIYGYTELRNRAIRANEGGILAFMMEGEREVPAGTSPFCVGNRPPETSCYNFGDNYNGNALTGTTLTHLWFFREHNRLARQLKLLNPCWDDDKLFQTARQINIAQYQYIFYYELIPSIIGYKNALDEGIIYETKGYVNDFDYRHEPGTYREYIVGTRWFHSYQQGFFDLYNNGTLMGSRSTPDDTFRPGILALNNTEADLTQGSYIQPAAKFDHIIDPLYTHHFLGNLQAVSDLTAVDFMRGRDSGFPPYNEYRKLCGLKPAIEWEDFGDAIDMDKIEELRRVYGDVNDVELMVAIYIEKWKPGAYMGPTLYCIMVKNLLLWRKSDKFFFEHGDFPAALTIPQLNEIRKTSIARIVCNNGDKVSWIQRDGFHRIGPMNLPEPCSEIPGVNLWKWRDNWCGKSSSETSYT